MQTDLRSKIAEAIQAKDKERLKELKQKIKQEIFLNSFDGSIPIKKWIEKLNPYLKFE